MRSCTISNFNVNKKITPTQPVWLYQGECLCRYWLRKQNINSGGHFSFFFFFLNSRVLCACVRACVRACVCVVFCFFVFTKRHTQGIREHMPLMYSAFNFISGMSRK